MARQRIGGSFAPPLTDVLLSTYNSRISSLRSVDPKLYDILSKLYACCDKWWNLPESTGGSTRPHPVGHGTIVDLDESVAKDLFDLIPWDEELDAYAAVLDGINPQVDKDLRNMAFHLLWHVKELARDREPLTSDKL